MTKGAYYNEIDRYAAQWLRNLIGAGLIAPGDVDERSIVEVQPDDLRGYVQCHFFAGIAGWSGALRLAGWPNDRPVWTGSCPCQPFSAAGKQQGFADPRHLWPEFRRLIAERHPSTIFGEQVAKATDWLRLVRSDLEALGYAVGAMPVEAASAGADHLRDRYWFVADADQPGSQGRAVHAERPDQRAAGSGGVVNVDHACFSAGGIDCRTVPGAQAEERSRRELDGDCSDRPRPASTDFSWVIGADGKARRVKPGVRLLADGVPQRVAKLRALGNAIDLRPAAQFIRAAMHV